MDSMFTLRGTVGHGRSLGHTVGMPTANLISDASYASVPLGVYAGYVTIGEQTYLGVTNVGTRPTVDRDPEITIETLILDFDRDIYGEEIELKLMEYLRPIRKMNSLEEVWDQVKKDGERARKLLSEK